MSQIADNAPHPIADPAPGAPHPILDILHQLIVLARRHAAILRYLFPEIFIIANRDVLRPGRGVRQAQVMLAPPLVAHVEGVHIVPNQCLRGLVIFCCSSALIIWLSILIGPANLPRVPVDLSLDSPSVLDVVNESAGHLSGNVVAADPTVCLLEVGLKLAEYACSAGY
ncbi:hypothetical protein OPQ81_011745 [Rhizoctonia solani]|nr:hypothetical protein OPQ81_011745 [Rhizoctonia solani]